MLIPVVAAFILLAADPVAYMGREVRVVDPGMPRRSLASYGYFTSSCVCCPAEFGISAR